ncbi:MAG: class I SAM-dependent methyltransferase [Candidatus Dadabacteria bacterium]|nr:class I SAM-dependent methyltransferase [Candidatus Dadabacteria bacterium]
MNRDSNNLSSEELSQIELIRDYWNKNPFEYELSKSSPGTIDYFLDVESHYNQKLGYLNKIIDYNSLNGKKILEIGCGTGSALVHFAKAGAIVSGVDISDFAIQMSRKNLELHNLNAEVFQKNGETLNYKDDSFDLVVAIQTLSYTPNPDKMIQEIHRVLKKGGEAYLIVHNYNSWLNILYKVFNNKPPREEAPAFNQYSIKQFEELLNCFSDIEITTDRFPYKTDRNNNVLTILYNTLFVPAFNLIPKKVLKSYGHHIIAKVVK